MSKRKRQYIGILAAVAAYYIIHEGAHLIYALSIGVFNSINFLGLGIQIDLTDVQIADLHMGLFCLAGAAATFIAGAVLILLRKKICKSQSKLYKAIMYYITVAMLLVDPLYLSLLYGLFGGGDMNGIALLLPETAARLIFGVLLTVNALVFWKKLLPVYTEAFREE